jgi:hypothetical protein
MGPVKATSIPWGLRVIFIDTSAPLNATQIALLVKFVSSGGGLVVAGQTSSWALQHPTLNAFTDNPINQLLVNFGILISPTAALGPSPLPIAAKAPSVLLNAYNALVRFNTSTSPGNPASSNSQSPVSSNSQSPASSTSPGSAAPASSSSQTEADALLALDVIKRAAEIPSTMPIVAPIFDVLTKPKGSLVPGPGAPFLPESKTALQGLAVSCPVAAKGGPPTKLYV